MKESKKIWVVSGKSESGDDYGPIAYSSKPSSKTLKKLVEEWDAEDWDGPGDFGSYVHLTIDEVEIIDL